MRKLLVHILLAATALSIDAQNIIMNASLLTLQPAQYEKAEFEINISAAFNNPYISSEIALDMLIVTPSGKEFVLPCFYISGNSSASTWKARFSPRESGKYSYKFRLSVKDDEPVHTDSDNFTAAPSGKDGFLHTNDFWTLKFDSGKLFRGIGENIGWESRSYEDPKWTYNYLLPTLSENGANFFRTWMCVWNLPLDWQNVRDTKRYESTEEYYNPGGIKRLDELVEIADSLGLYIMLTFETAGSLTNARYVGTEADRSDPSTREKFFTLNSARRTYKDKLRYIVARWGYSTSIAAWEFFNEIDNGVFTPQDSILVPHSVVTEWHSEMSRYLTDIDPYDHIITTSISHRDIIGMNSLPFMDINQKHIYKRTGKMRDEIFKYIKTYSKPYTIGEFGYEWDWNIDFSTITEGLDYDYKRGLWYGLFSPTPILPMTWWWEFFDIHNMTPYFQSVKTISDMMLESGDGSFDVLTVLSGNFESYAVKCGEDIYIYLLNNSNSVQHSQVAVKNAKGFFEVKNFVPSTMNFKSAGGITINKYGVVIPEITLESKSELVIIMEAGYTE